jgi:hypothetical protein
MNVNPQRKAYLLQLFEVRNTVWVADAAARDAERHERVTLAAAPFPEDRTGT